MIKQDYINRIMLIMNEAGSIDNSGLEMIGADVTQIDRYIEGSYIDAWRRCIKVMPRIWFKNKKLVTDTSHLFPNLADGTGHLILPSDFYLLSKFSSAFSPDEFPYHFLISSEYSSSSTYDL